jgi:tetratricopeptide (TPR) repeat protein
MADTPGDLKSLLQISDNDYEAMLRSAADCYTNGDLSSAITILTGLTTFNEDDSRPYKLLGSCLLLQNEHSDAETAYRKAFELDPDDPYTLVALGELLLKGLKLDEAVPLFEKLFEADPDGEHPAANRGRKLVQDYYKKMSG